MDLLLRLLLSLRAVFGPALHAILHATRVENAPNDVIAYARQVLYPTAADEDDRVLLQVVPLAWNVSRNFETIAQAYPGYLAQCGVGFLRRRRINASANATPLG